MDKFTLAMNAIDAMADRWCDTTNQPDSVCVALYQFIEWVREKHYESTTPLEKRDCDTCVNDGLCYKTVLQCKGYMSNLDTANALRAGMVDVELLSDCPPASTSTEHQEID